MTGSTLVNVILMVPPLLIAVILHEVAHGYSAEKLGDPTARNLGRITLNPIKHIDFFLTILVPGILILSGSPFIFGGAKPVPVNPMNLKNPKKDMVLVAFAGPLINFILVVICFGFFFIPGVKPLLASMSPIASFFIQGWLAYAILINLILGLFNLLPVPPLDGGRIAIGLLPNNLARPLAKLEPFGIIIVVILLATGVVRGILGPVLEFAIRLIPVS